MADAMSLCAVLAAASEHPDCGLVAGPFVTTGDDIQAAASLLQVAAGA